MKQLEGQERGLPGGDFNGEKCELSFSQWKGAIFIKTSFNEIQGACSSMILKVPKEILEKSFELGKT